MSIATDTEALRHRTERLLAELKDIYRQHHEWAQRHRNSTFHEAAADAHEVLVTVANNIETVIGPDAAWEILTGTPVDWQVWCDAEFAHRCGDCGASIAPGETFHSDHGHPHRNRCYICHEVNGDMYPEVSA